MSRVNELRLIARVAHMYHADDMKQTEISQILHISQATVSRLLRRANDEGIVKISIAPPRGTYPSLEAGIREKYGISEVIVADCHEEQEEPILAAIGAASAHHLETTLLEGEVIGVSSWSSTLQHMLDNLHPFRKGGAKRVVQLLGGMGVPSVQVHATQLTTRLADLTNAEPQLLPSPSVTPTAEAKKILCEVPQVKATLDEFKNVTVAYVGIGAMSPSQNLIYSGNTFGTGELSDLEKKGAVGDICLRFFNSAGGLVGGELYDRVVGMSLDELAKVPRVVGAAGGKQKVKAIAGALRGNMLQVLVTDRFTAERLLTLR